MDLIHLINLQNLNKIFMHKFFIFEAVIDRYIKPIFVSVTIQPILEFCALFINKADGMISGVLRDSNVSQKKYQSTVFLDGTSSQEIEGQLLCAILSDEI